MRTRGRETGCRAAALLLVLAYTAGCEGGAPATGSVEAYGLVVERADLGRALNLFIWPEYVDPALVREFERTYGVRVRLDYYDTNEAMVAKLQAGGTGQYDLVVASDYAVEVLRGQGLVEPLDPSHIPNLENLDPRFRDLPFDPGNVYSVAYQWGTSGIGVREDLVADPARLVESWALVFDPAHAPGPFAMLNDARETIGAALLYLGHSANSTDPGELAGAERLLMEQRARVLTYAPFATARDLLGSGDAVAVHNYSGDIRTVQEEVPSVRYLIPSEGAIVWTDNLAIPRGAPNRLLAEVFINFILDAEVGARLSRFTFYATPNAAALPLVDPELLADRSIYPEPAVLEKLEFLRELGPAREVYDRIWTRLRAGARD